MSAGLVVLSVSLCLLTYRLSRSSFIISRYRLSLSFYRWSFIVYRSLIIVYRSFISVHRYTDEFAQFTIYANSSPKIILQNRNSSLCAFSSDFTCQNFKLRTLCLVLLMRRCHGNLVCYEVPFEINCTALIQPIKIEQFCWVYYKDCKPLVCSYLSLAYWELSVIVKDITHFGK